LETPCFTPPNCAMRPKIHLEPFLQDYDCARVHSQRDQGALTNLSKIPSADDQSEITSSWNSFKDKMLSSIVLQANETFYKPTPKGTRKADRMVDYYVFDVGRISYVSSSF